MERKLANDLRVAWESEEARHAHRASHDAIYGGWRQGLAKKTLQIREVWSAQAQRSLRHYCSVITDSSFATCKEASDIIAGCTAGLVEFCRLAIWPAGASHDRRDRPRLSTSRRVQAEQEKTDMDVQAVEQLSRAYGAS